MKFSIKWKKSKKPKKQRLYRSRAPLHIKQKFVAAHLSKELRKKYYTRSLALKRGDKVKILRGQFKGKSGSVDEIDLKSEKVMINGIEIAKKDGSKTRYPINVSNLMITDLKLDDKMRQKIIDRKKKVEEKGNKNG